MWSKMNTHTKVQQSPTPQFYRGESNYYLKKVTTTYLEIFTVKNSCFVQTMKNKNMKYIYLIVNNNLNDYYQSLCTK